LEKNDLSRELVTARTVVRKAIAEDLPQIAAWPRYPWPNECFNMMSPSRRTRDERHWWEKIDEPDRCHYSVVLRRSGEVIGVHALVAIDWETATVANMGIRIRTDVCGRGYGQETLAALFAAVLDAGIRSIRLDVAATNQRAIRCYEKCGMRITGECWREHRGEPIVPSDSKWAFAMPHLREEGGKWMVRFHWMEIGQTGGARRLP